MDSTTPAPSKRSARFRTILGVMVVLLVAAVIAVDAQRRAAEDRLAQLSSQFSQGQGAQNTEQNTAKAREITVAVREHFYIPAEVEPTVALIVDAEKLRDQNAFYALAENSDYLLITNDKAILYRPSTDMILNVAPVTIQPPAPSAPVPADAPTMDQKASGDAAAADVQADVSAGMVDAAGDAASSEGTSPETADANAGVAQ
jgi:hypothetical protein